MDDTTQQLLDEMAARAEKVRRRRALVAYMEAQVTDRNRTLRGKQRRLQRKIDQRTARAEHR